MPVKTPNSPSALPSNPINRKRVAQVVLRELGEVEDTFRGLFAVNEVLDTAVLWCPRNSDMVPCIVGDIFGVFNVADPSRCQR